MKNLLLVLIVFSGIIGFTGCSNPADPSTWSNEKIDKWFEKGEWRNGWSVTPDPSINRKELAVAYFKNKERWDKAFAFLKDNDLSKLELRRYDIDGDNLYAPVTEYLSKNEEDAKFETHQKYIDIQYVISGIELMGLAPMDQKKEVAVPYDAAKDVEFDTVNKFDNHTATPDRFFIFFPSDIHRPGLKDGNNTPVRKIVVKVKID